MQKQQERLLLQEIEDAQHRYQPILNSKASEPAFGNVGMEKRRDHWEKSKEYKIKELEKQKAEKEVEECTFKPKIASSRKSMVKSIQGQYQNINAQAIKKFLRRQDEGQLKKKEEMEYFESNFKKLPTKSYHEESVVVKQ